MTPTNQLSLFSAATPAQLLTLPEAACVLGIGRSTLYELIGAGRLEVVHIGRAVRGPSAALIEFVEKLRAEARNER